MSKKISLLRDFLFITEKFTYPGFGRVLGLDAATVLQQHNDDRLRYDSKLDQLQYRYEIPKKYTNNKIPLSKFLALFDEVTTWAIVIKDRKRRPGVSVSFSAELLSSPVAVGKEIQINAQVVKSGKVMAFTKAEAIDLESGKIICQGQHIKYLPMPWLSELVLGPLLPFAIWFASNFLATKNTTTQLRDHDPKHTEDFLSFQDISADHKSAWWQVKPDHCNPLGAAHGGCQAMGMELLGQKYANNHHVLKSMSVSYMSTGKNELQLAANWIHQNEDMASMSVKVLSSAGKPISEGTLQFINNHDSKKKN